MREDLRKIKGAGCCMPSGWMNVSGASLFSRHSGLEEPEKLTSATEMMAVKVCVSGKGDTTREVYKYPRPESECVRVISTHECHRELFK